MRYVSVSVTEWGSDRSISTDSSADRRPSDDIGAVLVPPAILDPSGGRFVLVTRVAATCRRHGEQHLGLVGVAHDLDEAMAFEDGLAVTLEPTEHRDVADRHTPVRQQAKHRGGEMQPADPQFLEVGGKRDERLRQQRRKGQASDARSPDVVPGDRRPVHSMGWHLRVALTAARHVDAPGDRVVGWTVAGRVVRPLEVELANHLAEWCGEVAGDGRLDVGDER